MIGIVDVFVAAGDRQHPCLQDIGHTVGDKQWVTRVGDQARQSVRKAKPPFNRRQQHHTAIRRDAATIESSGDFLALDGWKTKANIRIVVHGGCGSAGSEEWIGLDTQSINKISRLRDTRVTPA